jgi:choline kinase
MFPIKNGLKLSDKHQLLVYVDGVNILGRSINTIKKNNDTLVVAGNATRL